eukprot:290414_1
MIKQKMRTYLLIHNTTSNNTTSTTSNSVISLSSSSIISNGHHHKNKTKHHSTGRPKPPSFSSHRNHHRPTVLPIQSLPVITQPSVPLSTSIDAILHHQQRTVPPLLNKRKRSPTQKRKRRKTGGMSHSNGALPFTVRGNDGIPDIDPMSLDFNLVTVPDEILNDVKSIVA